MSTRPAAVAFDVMETLISLAPIGERLEQVGLPADAVAAWFPRTLLYGLGLSVNGDYVPFPEAAAEALRAVSKYTLDDDAVAHVMGAFGELPAHPDVAPAMQVLSDAGIRMICLTNGSAAVTEAFLRRENLERHIERVVPTAEVQTWKPPAKVYLHGAAQLGLPPERVCLVAAHAWDCHAAKKTGLMAGWCARLEGAYGRLFLPADVMGADLVEVAQGLAALPA